MEVIEVDHARFHVEMRFLGGFSTASLMLGFVPQLQPT